MRRNNLTRRRHANATAAAWLTAANLCAVVGFAAMLAVCLPLLAVGYGLLASSAAIVAVVLCAAITGYAATAAAVVCCAMRGHYMRQAR